MHNRDENKLKKNQFDKEKRGWDGKQEKTLFDLHALEKGRAG
jgi:hypothetical protein